MYRRRDGFCADVGEKIVPEASDVSLRQAGPNERRPANLSFFSEWIELIYLKITVGLPKEPVVEVELETSGAKGIKAEGIGSGLAVNKQMTTTI